MLPLAKKRRTAEQPAPTEVVVKDASGEIEILPPQAKASAEDAGVEPKGTKDNEVSPAVRRLYRTKLKRFDATHLDSLIGIRSKLRVSAYLQEGIDKLAGTRRHLSSEFWATFFQEFALQSPMFENLNSDDWDPNEAVRPDLIDALLEARGTNPTSRRTAPFLEWLEYSKGDVNAAELALMLKSSVVCDRVTENMALEMQVAVLKFIGSLWLQTI